MTNEQIKNITVESLRDWFKKEKWVRISSSGKIAGKCGTSKNKKGSKKNFTLAFLDSNNSWILNNVCKV